MLKISLVFLKELFKFFKFTLLVYILIIVLFRISSFVFLLIYILSTNRKYLILDFILTIKPVHNYFNSDSSELEVLCKCSSFH